MPNTYTDRAVESLIINKMTQAQYDALPEKSDTELYLIDGGESSLFAEQMIVMPAASEAYQNRIVQFVGNSTMTYTTGYFYRCVLQGGSYVWKKINVQANSGGGGEGQTIQYEDLPEATGENVGQIIEYVGDDIPATNSSATISQTVGSGITDLSINVKTFESAEKPSTDEVVDFVCSNATPTNITVRDAGRGFTVTILNQDQIIDAFVNAGYGDNLKKVTSGGINYYPDGMIGVRYQIWIGDDEGQHYTNIYDGTFDIQEPDPLPEESYIIAEWDDFVIASETWQKNNTEVNLEDYGIAHSGAVNTGDTLEVVYSAATHEYKKGYFYINQPEMTDPVATISQTAGDAYVEFATIKGNTSISGTGQSIENLYNSLGASNPLLNGHIQFTYNLQADQWQVYAYDDITESGSQAWRYPSDLESYGLSITGTPEDNDEIICYYRKLYDLSINVDQFIDTEQPVQDETINFVADVTIDPAVVSPYTPSGSFSVVSVDSDVFYNRLKYQAGDKNFTYATLTYNGTQWLIHYEYDSGQHSSSFWGPGTEDLEDYIGVVISGDPQPDNYVNFDVQTEQVTTTWLKNNVEVDIESYGVSYKGIPADGSILTVNYTAPYVSCFNWNQINVQPASEGGSGIVWKTKMDIPTGITEWVYPQYNFGNVPAGSYEFYTQMKVSTGETVGYVTYKWFIKLTTNNGRPSGYKANVAYVVDGNYSSDGNYAMCEYTPSLGSTFIRTNNLNELIIAPSDWTAWATDLPGYYPGYSAEDGIEILKASSLKNTYTGEEYVATGKYFVGHQDTTGLIDVSGSFYQTRFINFPTQSKFGTTFWLDSNYEYFRIVPVTVPRESNPNPRVDYCHISFVSNNGDCFDAKINFSYSKYKLEIIEATGMFANVQLGYDADSWEHNLYLKKPIGISASGFAAVSGGDSEQVYTSVYSQSVNNFVPIDICEIGSTVTKDNFGTILQYTGDTDANYTNGYFYKATGTKVVTPESITCIENSGYGINITCTDLTGLIEYIATNYGYSEETMRNWFRWEYGTWYYYPENSDEMKWYWDQVGYFPDSAMINFFSFDQTPGNNIWWNMVNYQESSVVIQNGHWEQINVQPGSSPSYPSTMPTLLANGWSVDQVTGEITQTVNNISEVHANNVVIVSPAPISTEDYADAEVLCIGQGEGSLTFKCTTTPSNNITVNVICL